MMDFNALMDLRGYLTIQHHVPGRIRLKFGIKLLADPRARSLKKEVGGETLPPSIRNAKLNMFTRNVIIEYDPELIVPETLHEALTTDDEARFQELAAELEKVMTA